MAIDIEELLGAQLPPVTSSWDADDVILYHLGLGAGVSTEPSELRYVYERDLHVLPTYGVVPVMSLLDGMPALPGLHADFARMLHGEQDLEIVTPLPVSAEARHTGVVTGVFDKRSAALVVIETESRAVPSDTLLCRNRFSLFFRGEGGFGGESGPSTGRAAPDRAADHVVHVPTIPQQAALYRLNGDRNPLHIDPEFARLGGFERPILHGLCTYGMVCKAAVDAALGGAVTAVRGFRARFAGVVVPGETVIVEMWKEGTGFAVRASCKERESPVLSHAVLTVTS